MTVARVSLFPVLCLLGACAAPASLAPPRNPTATKTATVVTEPKARVVVSRDAVPDGDRLPENPRRVGDLFVQRFSGSFAKEPITLSEETVARESDWFIVEYRFEQGTERRRLRVMRHKLSDGVMRVFAVEKNGEMEIGRGALDQLLERTAFSADANHGEDGSHAETCLLGTRSVRCTTTRWKVSVGGEDALLSRTATDDVPGRDLTGEIRAHDGTVLFRADLVEARRGAEALPAGVASR